MAIMTCSAAQQMVIDQEMRKQPRMFYISGIGLAAQKSVEEFGWDRNRYTGICETQISGAGVGAAMAGAKPIISLSFCRRPRCASKWDISLKCPLRF
jgi:pyruvate/2-oxoglutarate/acetoin dehydrogenase E1 component